jgi:hypothetical protein
MSDRDERYERADNDRLRFREALDNLAHAAREFETAAAYTVEAAVEDEFITALEAAEAVLATDPTKGAA